jgi:3-oxoacyl-[acyl-carrier-protein] synthase-3
MKINNVGIIGIGSYVPDTIITNEELELKSQGTNAKWTKEKLGVEERHISLYSNENTSDLAYMASLDAIADANVSRNDIDLIILATSSPDRISPSTASIVAEKLNIKIPFFDINAVCSGFVYGLQLASNLISTGQYKNVLLIAAETYSKITDWSNRNCVFFGDGAGAVIVSRVDNAWISTDIYGDGIGKDIFTCHHGGKFQMNGKAVFDFATKILPYVILDSLKKNELTVDDISWLVPHQPSINILIKTAKILNLPIEKVVLNMTKFGNTAGASIPMALDSLYKKNLMKNGNLLVMPAVGSGWTWGVSTLKYVK